MLPPWNNGYLLPLWNTFLDGSRFLIRFDSVNLGLAAKEPRD